MPAIRAKSVIDAKKKLKRRFGREVAVSTTRKMHREGWYRADWKKEYRAKHRQPILREVR